jgi:cytochrome c heme-lyase
VDRCGKEVRYIIDYYAFEDEGEVSYTVDARPAGLGGIPDRMRVAFSKWQRGERWY